jgi:hypothetical protein
MEAPEEDFQDAQAYLTQDAISAAGGLRGPLQGLCEKHNAGALISIERPAVLACIGNKPSAAAKVVSHGDFLPSMGSEAEKRAAARVLGNGLRIRRKSARKTLRHDLSQGFALETQTGLRAGFSFSTRTLRDS